MQHTRPGAHPADHDIALIVNRNMNVMRLAPGMDSVFQNNLIAWIDQYPVGGNSKVIAGDAKGKARIVRIAVSGQQGRSPKHAVPIEPKAQVPQASRCSCGFSHRRGRIACPEQSVRISVHHNVPGSLLEVLQVDGTAQTCFGRFFAPQIEFQSEVRVPCLHRRIDKGLVFRGVFADSFRKNIVPHLRRDAHVTKIADHLSIMAAREIEILEALDGPVTQVDMHHRGIVRRPEDFGLRTKNKQLVDDLSIPRLEDCGENPKEKVDKQKCSHGKLCRGPFRAGITGGQW